MSLPLRPRTFLPRLDYFKWKTLLLERRVKQADLAPIVGISETQLSRAANGRRALLPAQVARLATALGVDASAFLVEVSQ